MANQIAALGSAVWTRGETTQHVSSTCPSIQIESTYSKEEALLMLSERSSSCSVYWLSKFTADIPSTNVADGLVITNPPTMEPFSGAFLGGARIILEKNACGEPSLFVSNSTAMGLENPDLSNGRNEGNSVLALVGFWSVPHQDLSRSSWWILKDTEESQCFDDTIEALTVYLAEEVNGTVTSPVYSQATTYEPLGTSVVTADDTACSISYDSRTLRSLEDFDAWRRNKAMACRFTAKINMRVRVPVSNQDRTQIVLSSYAPENRVNVDLLLDKTTAQLKPDNARCRSSKVFSIGKPPTEYDRSKPITQYLRYTVTQESDGSIFGRSEIKASAGSLSFHLPIGCREEVLTPQEVIVMATVTVTELGNNFGLPAEVYPITATQGIVAVSDCSETEETFETVQDFANFLFNQPLQCIFTGRQRETRVRMKIETVGFTIVQNPMRDETSGVQTSCTTIAINTVGGACAAEDLSLYGLMGDRHTAFEMPSKDAEKLTGTFTIADNVATLTGVPSEKIAAFDRLLVVADCELDYRASVTSQCSYDGRGRGGQPQINELAFASPTFSLIAVDHLCPKPSEEEQGMGLHPDVFDFGQFLQSKPETCQYTLFRSFEAYVPESSIDDRYGVRSVGVNLPLLYLDWFRVTNEAYESYELFGFPRVKPESPAQASRHGNDRATGKQPRMCWIDLVWRAFDALPLFKDPAEQGGHDISAAITGFSPQLIHSAEDTSWNVKGEPYLIIEEILCSSQPHMFEVVSVLTGNGTNGTTTTTTTSPTTRPGAAMPTKLSYTICLCILAFIAFQ